MPAKTQCCTPPQTAWAWALASPPGHHRRSQGAPGNGTAFGINVLGASFQPMLLAIMAPGGFIVFGLILGIVNSITNKIGKRGAGKEVEA